MGEPITHSKKGRGQTYKNIGGIMGLKNTRKNTNIFGETYYTNKKAKKRIYKLIKDFYKK